MAATENYAEVFAPFPYECVTKGEDAIRRYRGVVYTKWRNGKFVEFVYAIDGAALFEESELTMTEGGGDGAVPWYTYAVATHYYDTYYVKRDPDGDRIVCYVDKYRDTERYEWQRTRASQ